MQNSPLTFNILPNIVHRSIGISICLFICCWTTSCKHVIMVCQLPFVYLQRNCWNDQIIDYDTILALHKQIYWTLPWHKTVRFISLRFYLKNIFIWIWAGTFEQIELRLYVFAEFFEQTKVSFFVALLIHLRILFPSQLPFQFKVLLQTIFCFAHKNILASRPHISLWNNGSCRYTLFRHKIMAFWGDIEDKGKTVITIFET